ncbi:MAG TPA: hypothetical protein VFY52_04620, partial [Thermoleophilaceae bacterium]|nr:hypothetical protein [Thermoleophilaceae bacterium]
PTRDLDAVVTIPGRRWRARRWRVVHRRLRHFGTGDVATLYTGIGPNRGLIGRVAGGFSHAASDDAPGRIVDGHLFANVRRGSGVVPAHITGSLERGSGRIRELAVAVNGRIAAVGRSFRLASDPTEHFAFMVPEDALREGSNSVEVFEVRRDGRLGLLASASEAPERPTAR